MKLLSIVSLVLVGAVGVGLLAGRGGRRPIATSVDSVEDEQPQAGRGLRERRKLRQELANLYQSEYGKKKVRALGDWDDDWSGTSKSTKSTKTSKASSSTKTSKSSHSDDDDWSSSRSHRALGDWDDDWSGTSSKTTKSTKSSKSTSTKTSKSSHDDDEWVRG